MMSAVKASVQANLPKGSLSKVGVPSGGAMRGFAESQPSEHLSTQRLTEVGGVEVIKIANEEAGYPQKFLFLFSGG